VTDSDLCFTSATQLGRLYRARKVSPLEVMQAVLRQIDSVNPAINAYVTTVPEVALREARAATAVLKRKATLPPLHGIPVSIKDLIPTKGVRTTWGSKLFEHHVPTADALVVQRLKQAGAIIVGKTNTPEFGAGGTTFNAVFGITRNPWNPKLTAGGSSGGSAAALAAGMAPLSVGSDLGGSLRTPAAFCGVVGFRTTPGLVPVHPNELAWDLLSTVGPMARTVGDVALLLSAIAGPDDVAPLSYDVDTGAFLRALKSPSLKGCRVAWTPDLNGLLPVDSEVAAIALDGAKVLRGAGATVTVACPDFSGVRDIVSATRGLRMVALHADKLAGRRDDLQKGLVWNIEQGLGLTAEDIARGEKLRTALWYRVQTFMERYDFLALPTVAVRPFSAELPYPREINGKPLENYTEWFFLQYAITLTGLPAISVPCGFTSDGLPVGLQLVGRRRAEASVLRAAAAFERAAPWAAIIPPVAKPLARRPRAGANPDIGGSNAA
jgi:amidase